MKEVDDFAFIPFGRLEYAFSSSVLPFNFVHKEEVENFWKSEQKKMPYLFNGTIVSVESAKVSYPTTRILFNKTEYKFHHWSINQKKHIPGMRGIGTGTIFLDEENYYFVRRAKVSMNKGKIASVVGGIDFAPEAINSFEKYCKQIALKEIDEEVIIDRNISEKDLIPVGALYSDSEGIFVTRYIAKAKIIRCANDENSEVFIVPKHKLGNFFRKHKEEILDTDRAYIDLILRRKII